MKCIHCSDVHLDTPVQRLAQYEGAPVNEIRNATRRAFEKVIDAALAEQINFLIIAGSPATAALGHGGSLRNSLPTVTLRDKGGSRRKDVA